MKNKDEKKSKSEDKNSEKSSKAEIKPETSSENKKESSTENSNSISSKTESAGEKTSKESSISIASTNSISAVSPEVASESSSSAMTPESSSSVMSSEVSPESSSSAMSSEVSPESSSSAMSSESLSASAMSSESLSASAISSESISASAISSESLSASAISSESLSASAMSSESISAGVQSESVSEILASQSASIEAQQIEKSSQINMIINNSSSDSIKKILEECKECDTVKNVLVYFDGRKYTDYTGTIVFEKKGDVFVDSTGLFEGVDCGCKKEEMKEMGKASSTGLIHSKSATDQECKKHSETIQKVCGYVENSIKETGVPQSVSVESTSSAVSDGPISGETPQSADIGPTSPSVTANTSSNLNSGSESNAQQQVPNSGAQGSDQKANTSSVASTPQASSPVEPQQSVAPINSVVPQGASTMCSVIPPVELNCPPGFIKTMKIDGNCCSNKKSTGNSETNTPNLIGINSFCCCEEVKPIVKQVEEVICVTTTNNTTELPPHITVSQVAPVEAPKVEKISQKEEDCEEIVTVNKIVIVQEEAEENDCNNECCCVEDVCENPCEVKEC